VKTDVPGTSCPHDNPNSRKKTLFATDENFNTFVKAIKDAGYPDCFQRNIASMETRAKTIKAVKQYGEVWTISFNAETVLSGKLNIKTCSEIQADVTVIQDQIKVKRLLQSLVSCNS
jgi:hypothetical protein